MKTVAAAFASYQADVIPPSASPVQIEECRRAFYAGTYFMLMELATSMDESTPDEEGIAMLEALQAECEAFTARLGLITAPDISYTTPDPDAIKPILNELGQRIGAALPSGYGFNLLIFNFGAGGNMFYLSNGDRADMMQAMREFLRKQTS